MYGVIPLLGTMGMPEILIISFTILIAFLPAILVALSSRVSGITKLVLIFLVFITSWPGYLIFIITASDNRQ